MTSVRPWSSRRPHGLAPEAPKLEHLIELQHLRSHKRLNCSRVLTAMAEHSFDNEGHWKGGLDTIATLAELPRTTAYNALQTLLDEKIIGVDKPLFYKSPEYVRGVGTIHEFDYEDRPTFQLPPHLRSELFKFFRLKNWHNEDKEKEDMDYFKVRELEERVGGSRTKKPAEQSSSHSATRFHPDKPASTSTGSSPTYWRHRSQGLRVGLTLPRQAQLPRTSASFPPCKRERATGGSGFDRPALPLQTGTYGTCYAVARPQDCFQVYPWTVRSGSIAGDLPSRSFRIESLRMGLLSQPQLFVNPWKPRRTWLVHLALGRHTQR